MIDDTIFLVLCSSRDAGIKYFAERDLNDCDLDMTLRELLEGQFDRPLLVLRFNMVDKTSADVSEDIAREIANRARNGGERLTSGVMDFVERHLGMIARHAFKLEIAA